MPAVHSRTYFVQDAADLLCELVREPALRFDEPMIGLVEDTEGIDRLLRLSREHGCSVRFHVEELDSTRVYWRWLGRFSAVSLLSTPDHAHTLYLHLAGVDRTEEEAAVRYVHELVHGASSLRDAHLATGASALIAFELCADERQWHQFALLSKIIHDAFCGACEA